MANGTQAELNALTERWKQRFANASPGEYPALARQMRQELEQARTGIQHQGRAKQMISDEESKLLGQQKTQFEGARKSFADRLQFGLGQQMGQARRGFTQSIARRGLTGSGIEQAGLQAVQAAGAAQSVASLADFETKLNLAQEQERSQFRQASFGYLQQLSIMAQQADLERDMMRFQAQLAADRERSKVLGGILNLGVQVASLAFNPFGGAAQAPQYANPTQAVGSRQGF